MKRLPFVVLLIGAVRRGSCLCAVEKCEIGSCVRNLDR